MILVLLLETSSKPDEFYGEKMFNQNSFAKYF